MHRTRDRDEPHSLPRRRKGPAHEDGDDLVAGAVDGMKAESVVVLDNYGRPLTRPKVDENDPAGAASMERQQRLEREYAQRVVAMLEPIVGADHVRVNVALTLKRETTEQTQESWDPNMTVVRSQQTTSETQNGGATALATPPPGVVPGTAGTWTGGWNRSGDLDWLPETLGQIRQRLEYQFSLEASAGVETGASTPLGAGPMRPATPAQPTEYRYTLSDFERYPEWARDIKASTVVERDGQGRGVEVTFLAAAMGRSMAMMPPFEAAHTE